MTKKAIIFDFDGTLVDSMPSFGSVMLRILDESGVEYGDDIIKVITPLGYRGTAEHFRGMGMTLTSDELVEKMTRYLRSEYEKVIPEKEGVGETLRALAEKGYSLNVLTASPHSALDPCLERLGLMGLFDNVWSCEDFGTTKSDPAIYSEAAKRIGVPKESVVFVDDNIGAVRTAMSAGITSVGIYDLSSEDFREEFIETADAYAETFTELVDIIDQLKNNKKEKKQCLREKI